MTSFLNCDTDSAYRRRMWNLLIRHRIFVLGKCWNNFCFYFETFQENMSGGTFQVSEANTLCFFSIPGYFVEKFAPTNVPLFVRYSSHTELVCSECVKNISQLCRKRSKSSLKLPKKIKQGTMRKPWGCMNMESNTFYMQSNVSDVYFNMWWQTLICGQCR